MNKEHFNSLVSNYSNLEGQFYDLENLVHKFPYSQPIRMLNAKSSSSLKKAEFQQRLALAAFYATDRTVLRGLIEQGKVPSDLGPTTHTSPNKSVAPKRAAQKPLVQKEAIRINRPKSSAPKHIDAAKLREEVMHNLEELMKSKAHFLELEALDSQQKASKKPASKADLKAKPQKIVKPKITSSKSSTPPKKKLTQKSIRSSKKDELIDKFIASEPSITPNKAPAENQSDLSRASSELKEDLVSENLAIIFAGQGKTTKAIEIYKKLIWKFPQKKASFAARIEELKKK